MSTQRFKNDGSRMARELGVITLVTEIKNRRPTVAAKRHRADASSRKAEIIDVAVRIIRQKGYKAARLEDVARELNISRPTIYHHLESKEDILREIHDQTANLLSEVITRIANTDLSPEEKLHRFIVGYTACVIENRDRVAVFFQERAHLPKRPAARLKKKRQELEDLLKGMIREGIQKGVFRNVNVSMTTNAIFGMCNWAYQWYSPDGSLTPEAIGQSFADLIANGYLARS